MASSKIEIEKNDKELKHLGFVRIFAINAIALLSNIYDYAKQKSGPLKSAMGTAESAVTTIVGPVYMRFKDLPGDLLVLADEKVDEARNKFDECAPPLAKQVISQAQSMVQKASEVGLSLVHEAQAGGPEAAMRRAGSLFKELSVSQSANLWYCVNQVQPLHVVAEMALPTAAYWSDRYNKTVTDMAAKGYSVFSYFPLVPIDEMAKAYKQVEASKKGDVTTPDETETKTD